MHIANCDASTCSFHHEESERRVSSAQDSIRTAPAVDKNPRAPIIACHRQQSMDSDVTDFSVGPVVNSSQTTRIESQYWRLIERQFVDIVTPKRNAPAGGGSGSYIKVCRSNQVGNSVTSFSAALKKASVHDYRVFFIHIMPRNC